MEKSTDEVLHEILQLKPSPDSIIQYANDNKLIDKEQNLSQYLKKLQVGKRLKRKDIVVLGNLSEKYVNDIFRGEKKNPSRNIVLQLCFGLKLNIDESQKLLRMANVGELYVKDRRDSIIMFCLKTDKTVSDCDLILTENFRLNPIVN